MTTANLQPFTTPPSSLPCEKHPYNDSIASTDATIRLHIVSLLNDKQAIQIRARGLGGILVVKKGEVGNPTYPALANQRALRYYDHIR